MQQSLTRAVIYARYSCHNQRDVSIDQQLEACRKFARRQDIQIVGVYDDRAVTGTSDRRPGFQRMIRDAEQGGWEYVIVYALDRFARNRYDSAVYKRQLKNHGVKVLSAMENISDDPSGVLMESLLEGLAEYYSKELAQKTTRGMEDNAHRCMVNGPLPLGYIRGPDGKYAICEPEAAVVREIYRRVRDGDQLASIYRDLNAREIRTKSGKAWDRSSCRRLLENQRYTGVYIYKDIVIPGGIPQIIPQALFDAVQLLLHNKPNPRTTGTQRRRRDNGLYYLTGKLFCGHCHSPMIGISGHSSTGPSYYYYTCKGKHDKSGCRKKNVNRDKIETAIAQGIKSAVMCDDVINAMADASMAYQEQKANELEVESLRQQLGETTKALDNLMAAIEAGAFSPTIQTRLTELEGQKKELTARLTIATEDAEQPLTREEILAALTLYREGRIEDIEYRETLFDAFLHAAYVYDDHIRIVFTKAGICPDAKIDFDIDALDFDTISEDACIDGILGHQSLLYKSIRVNMLLIREWLVKRIRF